VRKGAGAGGTLVYFHRNQQYSITAVTTSTGTIAERYAYSAYGQPTILNASATIIATSAISNRYTYTGREWDATLGLHHFRARWMSPTAGRFLSRDPIGYEDGDLLYEYVKGGCINSLDPTGLATIECKCACRYGRFSIATVETECDGLADRCCARACQAYGEKCYYEGGGWRNADSEFDDDLGDVYGPVVDKIDEGLCTFAVVCDALPITGGPTGESIPICGGIKGACRVVKQCIRKPAKPRPPKRPKGGGGGGGGKGKCDFLLAWCLWGNQRPESDPGKGWKRNAPCFECFDDCKKNNGMWSFGKCPLGHNGPRWRGEDDSVWPDPKDN